MITIDLPEEPYFRAELAPDPRQVRDDTPRGPGVAPESWIDLAPVTAIPLTEKMAGKDEELSHYIAAEKGKFQYSYVRLGCTFYPSSGEHFDQAWLEVQLAPGAAGGAIAWSMVPDNVHESVTHTSKAKIGSQLKFLSSEMEEGEQFAEKLFSVRGYREGTSKPFWEMKRTDLADLNGLLRFHLVVRSPHKQETKGTVKLSTMIGSRKFLVFHSQRAANAPLQEFHLQAVK